MIQPANSNKTNSTIMSHADSELFEALTWIAVVVDLVSIACHLVYFALICMTKKIKKRTFLYTNHISVVNIIFIVMLTCYSFTSYPNFADPLVNQALCSLSEIVWIFSDYIRVYATLLVAIYRYIAVFKIKLYKKINNSNVYLFTPIVLVWLISFALPLISKFMFNTKADTDFMCLDGFSKNLYNAISYFIFNYVFLMVFPTTTIITIYILINRRLKSIEKKLKSNNTVSDSLDSLPLPPTIDSSNEDDDDALPVVIPVVVPPSQKAIIHKVIIVKAQKEKRFANQFIVICTFMVLTVLALSIYQLRDVIPNFDTVWVNWRRAIRIFEACMITAVPITSIYFHPSRADFIKAIKTRIRPI